MELYTQAVALTYAISTSKIIFLLSPFRLKSVFLNACLMLTPCQTHWHGIFCRLQPVVIAWCCCRGCPEELALVHMLLKDTNLAWSQLNLGWNRRKGICQEDLQSYLDEKLRKSNLFFTTELEREWVYFLFTSKSTLHAFLQRVNAT